MEKNGIPQPKGLPEERNEAVEKVQGLSGAAFDKEFVNMMVADHEKAVDTFRHEAATAQNPDVRDYAKNVLPTLREALEGRRGNCKATRQTGIAAVGAVYDRPRSFQVKRAVIDRTYVPDSDFLQYGCNISHSAGSPVSLPHSRDAVDERRTVSSEELSPLPVRVR